MQQGAPQPAGIGQAPLQPQAAARIRPAIAGGVSEKSQGVAFLLSIFLGALGVDQFYLGNVGLGILKLITAGGCGIWALLDVMIIGIGSYKWVRIGRRAADHAWRAGT